MSLVFLKGKLSGASGLLLLSGGKSKSRRAARYISLSCTYVEKTGNESTWAWCDALGTCGAPDFVRIYTSGVRFGVFASRTHPTRVSASFTKFVGVKRQECSRYTQLSAGDSNRVLSDIVRTRSPCQKQRRHAYLELGHFRMEGLWRRLFLPMPSI